MPRAVPIAVLGALLWGGSPPVHAAGGATGAPPGIAAPRHGTPLAASPVTAPLAATSSATASSAAAPLVPSEAPDDAHDCLIEPMTMTDLGSPTQGVVGRVLIERGESVTRGQPLVELESSVERAALDQAEARADMRSEVIAREAELALAKLELGRLDDLHARRLVPAQQRDEAAARRQVASAALVQALENRRLLQLELQRMRRELEQRTLRSPVDGVVVERLVDAGEFVRDNPVARLAQLDPLRVEVVLPARLFGTLGRGRGARIYPELGRGVPLAASIDVVDPMLDTRSGTFGVRLTLANADLAILGGQRCRVTFDDVGQGGGAAPDIAAAHEAVAHRREDAGDAAADAAAVADVDVGTSAAAAAGADVDAAVGAGTGTGASGRATVRVP